MGTWNTGPSSPCEKSRTVMIPIVFWASLPPWLSENSADEKSCRRRKDLSAPAGVNRRKPHDVIRTSNSAMIMPSVGERTMAMAVFDTPDQTIAPNPALAVPAPSSPPTSAWLDEDGMPNHQV